MSEPRLHIRNLASTNLLYYDGHWRAGTIGEEHTGERHVKYKVQWCEKLGDFAKTVLIRTDKHPQKLLDAPNLDFQGGIAYDGKKNDKARWWKVTYIEVSENSATVLFQSYTKGGYLAEKLDGSGVELIEIDGDTLTQDIPTRAKWELTIGGHALTPGEVVFVSISPLIFALGAITGGAATAATVPTRASCKQHGEAQKSRRLFKKNSRSICGHSFEFPQPNSTQSISSWSLLYSDFC